MNTNTSKIAIRDRGMHNVTHYVTEGIGLTIDSITKNGAGFIKRWNLSTQTENFKGNTIEELINIFKYLRKKYDLQVRSENSKDVVVIFTDNLDKVYGFFLPYVSCRFANKYIQLDQTIEIRPMIWNEDLTDAKDIANYAQFIIDELFIKDKYFYITPNQIPRRRIMHNCNSDIAKDIFPDTYTDYTYLKRGLFGGLVYCAYPGKIIDEPVIGLDLKSAYIYCMLVERHCMTSKKEVNPEDWEYYLDSKTKTSLGTYEITYGCTTNKARCFKNDNGERVCITYGLKKDVFVMTSIDLKLFLSIVNAVSIKCYELVEFDMDYLPDYFRETVINEYIKKEQLRNAEKRLYKLQKVIVNGCYGDTIKKIKTKDEYKAAYKKPCIAPQWGIWTTSYCKRLVITLGEQLEGWLYSDTDSIYCLDTKENREKVKAFNAKIRQNVKDFCDKFGYDFDLIKGLGEFVIEREIVKFRALKTKQYMYTTKEGTMVLKASGCDQKEIKLNDKLYELDRIPVGKRVFSFICDEPAECTINGIKYYSKTSYYEIIKYNLDAELYTYGLMLLTNDDSNDII